MSWSRVVPRRALFAAASVAIALHETPREKLSIYPAPPKDVIVVSSPSELERQIGAARRAATSTINDAHAHVQAVVSRWIGVEQAVEHRVKSIIAPDEPLTPGLLYVGVASLTGSIVARNRLLFWRLLLPPTLFFASLDYFLPKTSRNFSNYLGSLEDQYFPTFSEKHEIAKAHSAMTWERVKEATKDGRVKFEESVGSIVDRVQETTGLKLSDAFGRGQNAVKEAGEEVKGKVMEAVVKVEKVVEPVKEPAKEAEKKRGGQTASIDCTLVHQTSAPCAHT
ncbi:hypothetical protein EW146_g6249 [Bondarzewia mesenterica]|uniref:MICOS complex subunit n=1 Tax=Bondarzewia mesenterica TaxID=1095465 RepID=A0A4S4LP55_9AGAM|nr:hypothetical protein EW146_g6249 [Bondarzewia mesenterica]